MSFGFFALLLRGGGGWGGGQVLFAQAGFDEAGEERVRFVRPGEEFRVELAGHVERVIGDLDDFREIVIRMYGADGEAGAFQGFAIDGVELVAMPVAFADLKFAVELMGPGAFFNEGVVPAEAHRATQIDDFGLLLHQANDRMRRMGVEFGALRSGQPADVAGVFDDSDLHAET